MVSAREFAQAGFKYVGTAYSAMDCQKFVERCMADVGLKEDLPGSNAWFRRMTWTGTPEECMARFGGIPKGALLFILEAVSDSTPAKYREDGIGDATHIGIKTGQGKGAIHSSKSKGGVCESEFRDKTIPNGGWNRVGLYNKFAYDGIPGDWDDGGGDSDSGKGGTEGRTAIVTAATGKTVNMRKRKSTSSKLVERVPIGAVVRVIRVEDGWSRVAYTDPSGAVWCGWMMSAFLREDEGEDEGKEKTDDTFPCPAGTTLYAVTIPYLTEDQARGVLRRYAGAWMVKEDM